MVQPAQHRALRQGCVQHNRSCSRLTKVDAFAIGTPESAPAAIAPALYGALSSATALDVLALKTVILVLVWA